MRKMTRRTFLRLTASLLGTIYLPMVQTAPVPPTANRRKPRPTPTPHAADDAIARGLAAP